MAREGQRATPTIIKKWKSDNSINEEHVVDLLEQEFPGRFFDKEKIVHKALLDVWHNTDDGESVNEEYILSYITEQFFSLKLIRFDNYYEKEHDKLYAFYNITLNAYLSVHESGQSLRLSQMPDYTEEIKKVVMYYHPSISELCEYINNEFDKTTINFPRDYQHGDELYVVAKVKDNDIYFVPNASRLIERVSQSKKQQDSVGNGCALFFIPVILGSLLLLIL